jgi:uncharacterized protein (TIGR00730 family)
LVNPLQAGEKMPRIRSAVVFCGSRFGKNPAFRAAAVAVGEGLAQAGIRLVYGGGRIGLMGAVADAALTAGGDVIGIIPEFLTRREVAHPAVHEMIVTDSMHSRKQRMFELADAFIMLPGGLGTYDEIVEITTWRQLGLHDRPVLLCDVAGSTRPLMAAFEAAVEMGFAEESSLRLVEVVDGPEALLTRLGEIEAALGYADAAKL